MSFSFSSKKKNQFTKGKKPLSKNLIRDLSGAGLLQICSDFIAISKAAPKLECIPNPPLSRLEHVLNSLGSDLKAVTGASGIQTGLFSEVRHPEQDLPLSPTVPTPLAASWEKHGRELQSPTESTFFAEGSSTFKKEISINPWCHVQTHLMFAEQNVNQQELAFGVAEPNAN